VAACCCPAFDEGPHPAEVEVDRGVRPGRVRASPSSSTTSQARTSRPNPAGSSPVRRSIQARIAAVVSSCSIPSSARTSAILVAELWLRGRTRSRTSDNRTECSPGAVGQDGLQPVKHPGDRRGRPAAGLGQADSAAGRGQQQRAIAALQQHLRGYVFCRAGHLSPPGPGEAAVGRAAVFLRIARSPGWQGPAGPGPGRHSASLRDSAGARCGAAWVPCLSACRSCRGQDLRHIRAAWCRRDTVDPLQGLVDLPAIVLAAAVEAEPQMTALRSEAQRRGLRLPGRFAVPDRDPGNLATRPKRDALSCRWRERWTRP
jgi:hypothetical protein